MHGNARKSVPWLVDCKSSGTHSEDIHSQATQLAECTAPAHDTGGGILAFFTDEEQVLAGWCTPCHKTCMQKESRDSTQYMTATKKCSKHPRRRILVPRRRHARAAPTGWLLNSEHWMLELSKLIGHMMLIATLLCNKVQRITRTIRITAATFLGFVTSVGHPFVHSNNIDQRSQSSCKGQLVNQASLYYLRHVRSMVATAVGCRGGGGYSRGRYAVSALWNFVRELMQACYRCLHFGIRNDVQWLRKASG